jgi:hypothetical protein
LAALVAIAFEIEVSAGSSMEYFPGICENGVALEISLFPAF